jgi:putative membrane protein
MPAEASEEVSETSGSPCRHGVVIPRKDIFMKRHHLALAAAFLAASFTVGSAFGQNGEETKKLDSQESAFLRQAAQEDVFEMRLGQYAAKHAEIDDTKQLGRQMATDHEADLKKIEQVAKDHGVDLKTHDNDLTPQQKMIYDTMTSKAGKNFDKDYTKLVLAHHNESIPLYMRERDNAADVSVREYAKGLVPTLESHKKMATEAQKKAWGNG